MPRAPKEAVESPLSIDYDEMDLVQEPPKKAAVAPAVVTLHDAFYLLCNAMLPLLEDNLPAYMHCQEIQGWMTDGGTNGPIAWQHAVQVLEGVLGVKLGS